MNKDGRGREMKELIEQLGKLTDTGRQWGNLRHKLVDIVFHWIGVSDMWRNRF